MSWLGFVLVGVVLLIVGYMAPLPPPLPVILQILGWVLFAIGVFLLVMGLLGTSTAVAAPVLLLL